MTTSLTSKLTTDVIVIGGGATGAGIARDCALRGVKTLLLERYDIATGATGRNHGLLHSGARYAVTDKESAKECIEENKILRHIATHCIEPTHGLFLTLPEDDLNFQSTFLAACHESGIPATAIDPAEALKIEPAANPHLLGAVKVPDGAIDPFRLTMANILDAKENGGQVLTYHKVIGLLRDKDTIIGVKALDCKNNIVTDIYAQIVVNASGIWGQQIAEYADLKVSMFPSKGSLLIMGHRINHVVLNRCRKPADADILVPGDTISVIGTTSSRIPYDEIDNLTITADEVDLLIQEGSKLAPNLAKTRILRAYAGVRPLIATDNDPSGRNVSRGIVLLDHEKRDGLKGFITITGGKLITYRLMAEWTTDLICQKLNITAACTTATVRLPGANMSESELSQKTFSNSNTQVRSAFHRHGDRYKQIAFDEDKLASSLVCECEAVSAGEVKYATQALDVKNLIDLRRRTRVGMGTCQGELCAYRAAGLLNYFNVTTTAESMTQLAIFLNERWKGVRPIAWGDTLRESEFTNWVYQGVCGLTAPQQTEKDHEI